MAAGRLYIQMDNGKAYQANILAGGIERKYPGIRETNDYCALEDRFFDYTQACDVQEQRNWMSYYMAHAIRMDAEACRLMSRGKEHWNAGVGLRKDAALQFIVAYDMYIG